VAITVIAVLLEQVANGGIDNLSVPIGVAALWRWLAQA
jgi:dolichol kinase